MSDKHRQQTSAKEARMSDDLVKRYRQLQEVIGGCHDGYCVVRKPKGMHTNGGCACLEDLRLHERSRIGGSGFLMRVSVRLRRMRLR